MEETTPVRTRLPRLVRRPPADLSAVLVATVLVNVVVFVPGIRETALRVPIGLAFVLFVPGYAVIAGLFPKRGPSEDADSTEVAGSAEEAAERPRSWWGRIDGIDRIALSVAFSVTIVPTVGFATSVLLEEVRPGSILLAVSLVTMIATVVAIQRRAVVPPDERFRVPYREWTATVRATVLEPDTRGEAVLNVALIGAVVLALGSAGYAATVLPQDDQFSSIYVLPEDGEEIDPDEPLLEIEPGGSQEVLVGVENEEERTVEYAVVAVEQEVERSGGETRVVEQRELDRFEMRLAHGETRRYSHTVEPTMSGEDVRVAWLLYVDGDAPDEPSAETADYHVHAWVDEGSDET